MMSEDKHGLHSQFRKLMYYKVSMTIYTWQTGQLSLLRVLSVSVISVPDRITISEKQIQTQISIAHVCNCYAALKCFALGNNLPQANISLFVTTNPPPS